MPTLYVLMVLLGSPQVNKPVWSAAQLVTFYKDVCERAVTPELLKEQEGDGLRVIKWKCVEYKPAK
jgi:hypothetical protein